MNTFQPIRSTETRRQYVFTLLDGSSRAWAVSDLDGRAVLVAVPLDVAQGDVRAGRAVELPLGTVPPAYGRQVQMTELGKDGACCGSCAAGKPCDKAVSVAAGAVDVAVVGTQKTEVAFAGRGRLVSGAAVGEPLFAVAEGTENRVACCGGACEGAGTPNAIVFDRFVASEGGGYSLKESFETPLPKQLSETYAQRAPSCLPWVRIARDPEKFRGCLAAARALGPIKNSKGVSRVVGEYLMTQDQEVFLVILLDVQLGVRGISEIARGSRDKVDVPVPDVLRIGIVDGASGMILVHNHPSGAAVHPSDSDKMLTKTLKEACETVHLEMLDHVIVAGDKTYSFAKSGKM